MARTPEAAAVRRAALPLRHPDDLDPLLDRVGPARLVLVGEASHGTSEFYRWRAGLTRRLVGCGHCIRSSSRTPNRRPTRAASKPQLGFGTPASPGMRGPGWW
ncbi:MAG TPA: hypothetical protein VE709_01775 [Pseudonocardiaceae bacterium]|jgi:hypothetical protein|nr:hypothetical protein [Pseudonocardiaceae bacterium]